MKRSGKRERGQEGKGWRGRISVRTVCAYRRHKKPSQEHLHNLKHSSLSVPTTSVSQHPRTHAMYACTYSKYDSQCMYLLSDFIHLSVKKVETAIKVLVLQHASLGHAVWHLSLHFHHQLQHFVVGFPREENLSSVQLIYGTAHRPHVYTIVILATYYC